MKRGFLLVALIFLSAGAPYENTALDGDAFNRPVPGLDETLLREIFARAADCFVEPGSSDRRWIKRRRGPRPAV